LKSTDTFITVRSSGSSWAPTLLEVWGARDMLFFMVLRDFKIRFKQSLLGFAWVILQPLLSTLVFSMVVGKALNVSFEAPYPLAFLSGLMCWNYFSKVMTNGITTVVNESDMIKKVYFPRLILPLYQAISYLIDFVVALLIFFVISMFYAWPISSHLLMLPVFMLLTLLLSMGVSFWLGPINVRFRDIQIIIPLFLQILFILTPVMYPIPVDYQAGTEGWIPFFYNLNPMVGIVEGFRLCLLGQGSPWALPHLIAYLGILIFFGSGVVFFTKSQEKFADVI
jgi:lipopolysaccharide transport system permease protein